MKNTHSLQELYQYTSNNNTESVKDISTPKLYMGGEWLEPWLNSHFSVDCSLLGCDVL